MGPGTDLPVFYHPDLHEPTIELLPDEATHARVLRLRFGESVYVCNGKGQRAKATFEKQGKTELLTNVVLTTELQARAMHTLAMAATKNTGRVEWIVEKITELGIARLVLINTKRSERMRINTTRLHRIAVSALKQSGNLWIPEIIGPVDVYGFIEREQEGERWVAHCMPDLLRQHWNRGPHPGEPHTVLIGPEGDFTPEEIAAAMSAGFRGLDLGPHRLRTETAAMVAAVMMSMRA